MKEKKDKFVKGLFFDEAHIIIAMKNYNNELASKMKGRKKALQVGMADFR